MFESRDAPFPELKKTHTMAHKGRPWTDYKPPSSAPVWASIEGLGRYYILLAALELDVFDTLQRTGPTTIEVLASELDVPPDHLRSLLDGVVAQGLLDQFVDVPEEVPVVAYGEAGREIGCRRLRLGGHRPTGHRAAVILCRTLRVGVRRRTLHRKNRFVSRRHR